MKAFETAIKHLFNENIDDATKFFKKYLKEEGLKIAAQIKEEDDVTSSSTSPSNDTVSFNTNSDDGGAKEFAFSGMGSSSPSGASSPSTPSAPATPSTAPASVPTTASTPASTASTAPTPSAPSFDGGSFMNGLANAAGGFMRGGPIGAISSVASSLGANNPTSMAKSASNITSSVAGGNIPGAIQSGMNMANSLIRKK